MYHLLYLSTATALYDDQDLEDILTVSRRNNTALDITGLLLYHDGAILQLLEGDKAVVQSTYARIAGDDRHNNVMLVLEHESPERQFSDWAMGFRRMSKAEWHKVEGYLPVEGKMIRFLDHTGSEAMMTFIRSFYKTNFERMY